MPPKRKARAWDVSGRDVPRELFPSGRVKIRLGSVTKDDADRRRSALTTLRGWHAWDVVRAIADDRLPLSRAVAAVKERGDAGLTELRAAIADLSIDALPSVRSAANEYLEWYGRERRAQSTKQVRSRLKRFCEQPSSERTVGDVRIDRLTKDMIEQAIHAIGGADSTKEVIRLAVSGLFTWWTEREREAAEMEARPARFAANPAGRVARKERAIRVVTATGPQMVALFNGSEIYQSAYLRSLAHLGLREAELVHTRLHADLDLRDWTWRIQARGPDPRCGCPDCKGTKGWAPKSKRSVRTIKVPTDPPQLRAAILHYLGHYPCEPGDFVFRNPRTGNVWDPGRFDADFRNLCDRAGVRRGRNQPGGLTPHAIRHTCATELLRNGVDSAVIAALLGDTLETIVKTYLHITADDVAAAIQKGPGYEI